MKPKAQSNTVGRWGEDLAADMLIAKGYAIVERNWRMGHYEIDIVAMHHGRIVFVEVKSRTSPDEDAAAAVDRRKMQRMSTAAHHYVLQRDIPHEVQFDIITVTGNPDNHTIDHIPDAFLPPLKTY